MDRETTQESRSKYAVLFFVIYEFTRRTPYNFDLTLREAENNSRLGFYEENLDLFHMKDLKGNQYDTLGYLFFKTEIEYSLVAQIKNGASDVHSFYQKSRKDSLSVNFFHSNFSDF